MSKILNKYAFLFIFVFFAFNHVLAQKPLNPLKNMGPKTKIELLKTDTIVGENAILKTRTFIGHVIFKHNGVLLGCDRAIHNMSSNFIEAFGSIVLNQGDTLTIVGDTLNYDGNARIAKISGSMVTLRDKKVTLRTQKINYDLNSSVAYYPVPGTIYQDSSRLISDQGYYNTNTKIFKYIGNVRISNPSFVLVTDSLDYNANTKDAFFNSKTTINSKDGNLTAFKGKYNIQSKISQFEGRAKVKNLEYSIEADTLSFDSVNDAGIGKGNVLFNSFADSLITVSSIAERKKGLTFLKGLTLTEKVSGKDTLYISADKLWIHEKQKDTLAAKIVIKTSKPSKKRKEKLSSLMAQGNVKIYRKDFQSISDSLNYNIKDSMIVFYGKPILWSLDNQMEADTITMFMKAEQLTKISLRQNCFVIQTDTLRNFNQIKGRKVDAYFAKKSVLKTIKVEGNGESLYFALDDKNKIIGLNKVQCSSMQFNFENKKINIITFRGKPETVLIPPKEITSDDLQLENFAWKGFQKPTKKDLVSIRFLKLNHRKFKY